MVLTFLTTGLIGPRSCAFLKAGATKRFLVHLITSRAFDPLTMGGGHMQCLCPSLTKWTTPKERPNQEKILEGISVISGLEL